MSSTIVTVRTPAGTETDLEIPADIAAAEVVRLIVAGLHCPPDDLVLYTPDLGRCLNDNETLSQAGILYGYRLQLQARGSRVEAAPGEGPARAWRQLDGAATPDESPPTPPQTPAKTGGYAFKRVD